MNDPVLTVADNVRRLMTDRGESQASLGKRAKLSQRAVGDLLTYGTTHRKNPTLRTVGSIAGALDVPVWLLLIPGMPVDLLNRGGRVAHLVHTYTRVPDDARQVIERIAEAEAKYSGASPPAKRAVPD